MYDRLSDTLSAVTKREPGEFCCSDCITFVKRQNSWGVGTKADSYNGELTRYHDSFQVVGVTLKKKWHCLQKSDLTLALVGFSARNAKPRMCL